MNKELAKETYTKRVQLDNKACRFVYNEEIEMTYARYFNYTDPDTKLLSLAKDEAGIISDCYILYAIAHLGVCDKNTISMFLEALQKIEPSLNIISGKNEYGIGERLRLLEKRGYIFKLKYNVDNHGIDVPDSTDMVSFFTTTESGYELVKQRLQKRLTINKLIQAKPINELIGWAAAAMVGAYIACHSRFEDYLERVLRTKQLGSVYLPCELKVNAYGEKYYIALVSAFLYRNKHSQTENDFNEYCAYKLNVMKNYLACRTQKGQAVVVCAVADNADLNKMVGLIYQTDILGPYLEQIYFTGEGIIKSFENPIDCFLQMRLTDTEEGYEIMSAKPAFLEE